MASNIDESIVRWEAVVNRYVEHRRQTVRTNPEWPPLDLRLGLYGLTGNVLVTGLLNTKMIKSCLLANQWWDSNVIGNRELAVRQHQTDQFVVHSKVAIYTLFFSYLEAILRQMLRVLMSGTCNNGYDAFANVYGCLLAHVNLQHHKPFLDFARELRNLIHNNGTYINKAGANLTLVFRGSTYIFEHGRKVDFAYEDLLIDVYDGALSLADDLIASTEVKAIVKAMPVTLAS